MPSTDSCLFVGDLSVICTESHLKELFQEYGRVTKAEINRGQKSFRFLGYGFVTMSTVQEAKIAMQNLNGVNLFGRKLRINCSTNHEKYKEPPRAEVAFTFISQQIVHLAYEQTFHNLFSCYGCEVIDVAIKTYKVDLASNMQHGTGFVHFPQTQEGVLSAKRAVDDLANVNIKDISYNCKISTNLQDILRERPDLNVPFKSRWPTLGEGKDGEKKKPPLRVHHTELPYVTVEEFRGVIRHAEAITAQENAAQQKHNNNRAGHFQNQSQNMLQNPYGQTLTSAGYNQTQHMAQMPMSVPMPVSMTGQPVYYQQQQQQQEPLSPHGTAMYSPTGMGQQGFYAPPHGTAYHPQQQAQPPAVPQYSPQGYIINQSYAQPQQPMPQQLHQQQHQQQHYHQHRMGSFDGSAPLSPHLQPQASQSYNSLPLAPEQIQAQLRFGGKKKKQIHQQVQQLQQAQQQKYQQPQSAMGTLPPQPIPVQPVQAPYGHAPQQQQQQYQAPVYETGIPPPPMQPQVQPQAQQSQVELASEFFSPYKHEQFHQQPHQQPYQQQQPHQRPLVSQPVIVNPYSQPVSPSISRPSLHQQQQQQLPVSPSAGTGAAAAINTGLMGGGGPQQPPLTKSQQRRILLQQLAALENGDEDEEEEEEDRVMLSTKPQVAAHQGGYHQESHSYASDYLASSSMPEYSGRHMQKSLQTKQFKNNSNPVGLGLKSASVDIYQSDALHHQIPPEFSDSGGNMNVKQATIPAQQQSQFGLSHIGQSSPHSRNHSQSSSQGYTTGSNSNSNSQSYSRSYNNSQHNSQINSQEQQLSDQFDGLFSDVFLSLGGAGSGGGGDGNEIDCLFDYSLSAQLSPLLQTSNTELLKSPPVAHTHAVVSAEDTHAVLSGELKSPMIGGQKENERESLFEFDFPSFP